MIDDISCESGLGGSSDAQRERGILRDIIEKLPGVREDMYQCIEDCYSALDDESKHTYLEWMARHGDFLRFLGDFYALKYGNMVDGGGCYVGTENDIGMTTLRPSPEEWEGFSREQQHMYWTQFRITLNLVRSFFIPRFGEVLAQQTSQSDEVVRDTVQSLSRCLKNVLPTGGDVYSLPAKMHTFERKQLSSRKTPE